MFWTKTFIPTIKETPQEAESTSHKLLLRAGLARMLMAGAYSYLPLGFKVLEHIERIIGQEMQAVGASEVLLPALQPLELWQKTGRDKDIGEVMFRFVDRKGRNLALGPTHEEVITQLVAAHLCSYRQLPIVLYQIQTKFRDEIRPRFGLIRACEFIMKDAYSFDRDEAGLELNYRNMFEAYNKIFKRLGLAVLTTEADPGIMGGKVSHEFMVPARDGEDRVLVCSACSTAKVYKEGGKTDCPKCGAAAQVTNTIEIGHTFKLGTRYSSMLGAKFLDADGNQKPAIMGCYGIGVSRLISAVIEQNNDKDGIIWPREAAPYQVIMLPLDVGDKTVMDLALAAYAELGSTGIEVLFDDRDERPGVKFKDADLLGIPLQVVIGREGAKRGQLELKVRATLSKSVAGKSEVMDAVNKWINTRS